MAARSRYLKAKSGPGGTDINSLRPFYLTPGRGFGGYMGHNEDLYDVIIAGAGPAGLSAAIYMARARYRVLVMEKEKIGGQITIASEIVN